MIFDIMIYEIVHITLFGLNIRGEKRNVEKWEKEVEG
jgi:hypothetical protein